MTYDEIEKILQDPMKKLATIDEKTQNPIRKLITELMPENPIANVIAEFTPKQLIVIEKRKMLTLKQN